MKKVIFTLLILPYLTFGIVWYHFWQGIHVAKTKNKALMVYFYQNNCKDCRKMTKTTLASPIVLRYLSKHFIVSDVNVSTLSGSRIGAQFLAINIPTVEFINPHNNDIIFREIDWEDPAKFLKTLQHACKEAKKQGLNC